MNFRSKSSFVGVSACFWPQNDQFISFFTFFFFRRNLLFNLIHENQLFKIRMKKAPFRDHCIPVKIHLYNQPAKTFSEQMLLSDFDRQKLAGKSQNGMRGNEKIGLGNQK